MNKFIEFVRMFLSYGLLMLIIVLVCALGIFLGIKWAKKSNAEKEAMNAEVAKEVVSENK